MNVRRAAILLSLALLAASLPAEAQTAGKVSPIGVMTAYSGEEGNPAYALRDGLRDLGYAEGHNLTIDWLWARGDATQYPGLAAELVRLRVDVIVAGNNAAVQAARSTTQTIPIVMVLATDPVHVGFAANIARPGGGITGLTTLQRDVTAERLQLLKEAVRDLSSGYSVGSHGAGPPRRSATGGPWCPSSTAAASPSGGAKAQCAG
jgi:putative ABC transport system substrate-binding protein